MLLTLNDIGRFIRVTTFSNRSLRSVEQGMNVVVLKCEKIYMRSGTWIYIEGRGGDFWSRWGVAVFRIHTLWEVAGIHLDWELFVKVIIQNINFGYGKYFWHPKNITILEWVVSLFLYGLPLILSVWSSLDSLS